MKYDLKYNNKKGHVIVFLHGWGLNRKVYNKIISCLYDDVNYLNIDLFGFGESNNPKEYFDVYEYAYQIFLLLKKLSITKIILVGHSFGGRLAIILSSVYRLEIKALVLTSSAGLNRFSLIRWFKVNKYKFYKKLVGLKLLNKSALNKFGSRDYVDCNDILRGVFVRVVNEDLSYLLSNINIKTYLVWDKKDRDTPYWICSNLNRCINNSRVVLYDYGGHFVAFENFRKFANLLSLIDLSADY